jgi:E3 ubiquitin-protein ligase TRIP12
VQAKALREGFSKVFPISDLRTFTVDELVMLFGNSEEDWGVESQSLLHMLIIRLLMNSPALNEVLKADHGFTGESRAIQNLVQIMSEFDASTRRNYLQFITGSPKLPIGGMSRYLFHIFQVLIHFIGFRGLNPALTVVRKPHEPPLTADDYLPSVMTCVNYLKLPDYSSKDTMREKLKLAMQEGIGSFHLS